MHAFKSLVLLSVMATLLMVCQAAALTAMPSYHNVNLIVSNDAGARFDDYGNDSYNFFSANQSPSQGLNALHITNSLALLSGQVTFSNEQSGTFYLADTGGRGWNDDGILMIAVNGTVPEDFSVHVTASGYQWTPVPKDMHPAYANLTYFPVALDETFTRDDLLYGPQIWKPCSGPAYPIFDHQNMSDTANTFSILFIDLNAGTLGNNVLDDPDYMGQPIVDNGTIKVQFGFTGLHTLAAFNAYAYCAASNQGQGIRWSNRLTDSGASGYAVVGIGTPTPVPFPGYGMPTDPDGDGLYEDLNANGRLDFNDVQIFFRQMRWISENEPIVLFDFNRNERIDFNDLQLLFRKIGNR